MRSVGKTYLTFPIAGLEDKITCDACPKPKVRSMERKKMAIATKTRLRYNLDRRRITLHLGKKRLKRFLEKVYNKLSAAKKMSEHD